MTGVLDTDIVVRRRAYGTARQWPAWYIAEESRMAWSGTRT